MAKITVKVTGGKLQEMDVETVKDAKAALGLPNHAATVNGETVTDDYELEDYEFLALTEAVKGGC